MNFISKIILVCLFVIVFVSCQSSTKDTSVVESDKNMTETTTQEEAILEETKTALTISSFVEPFPEERGCGCDFSKNKSDEQEQKYIFVNNDETTDKQVAFMKINGVMVRFVQTNHQKLEENKNFDRNNKNTFVSENASQTYTLEVEVKGKNGEYTIIECTGTIKITDEAGQSVTETFFGICAC